MGLLRHRMSRESFAERCNLSEVELSEMLEGGEVSGGVLSEYAALENEGVALEVLEEVVEVKELDTCVFGRPVRNSRLQIVVFGDGREGKVRKKESFRPRAGLPCEVEASAEEGFLTLVGRYRDNGVRLS